MREIKFRAWDKNRKGFFGTSEAEVRNGEIVMPDNFVVMQYTGLHDKNGKEIYEGDIVVMIQKGKYWDGKPYEVKWKMRKLLNGFNVSQGKNLEVIGNIYENPELLKDKL